MTCQLDLHGWRNEPSQSLMPVEETQVKTIHRRLLPHSLSVVVICNIDTIVGLLHFRNKRLLCT